MSCVRYYLDEYVSKAVAQGLRERGVDVRTVVEAGLRGASDEQHLARALEEGRVIFSHDVDFLRLHAQGKPHAGIVHGPAETRVGSVIR